MTLMRPLATLTFWLFEDVNFLGVVMILWFCFKKYLLKIHAEMFRDDITQFLVFASNNIRGRCKECVPNWL